MAFKGKHVLCNSTVDFTTKLKDFLVNECGWIHDPASPTRDGPGGLGDDTYRIAQEDKHAFILGWFLKSNGEDGNQNIPLHIGTWNYNNNRRWQSDFAYLSAGITSSDISIALVATIPNLVNGDIIQIGDEMILVGIAGATLTNCARGQYGTTAAAHDIKDVALRLNISAPALTIFGARDLANPIMSSTSPEYMLTSACATDIAMDSDLSTAYDDNKLDNCSLVKLADGRMRFITGQTCEVTGKLRLSGYGPFYTLPGMTNISIISAGMHPQGSRHQQLGTGSILRCPCLRYTQITSPKDCWFYGSKDGVAVVVLMGNANYMVHYIGLFQPFGNTAFTTATSITDGNIAAGSTQIKVANAGLFTKGGRYMLLSNAPATDWHNNRNQQANTYMGCPGTGGANSWPNLDADEAIFEYVLVTDVNLVTNVLTLYCGTCYSYVTGGSPLKSPLIGEALRCHVGPIADSTGASWVQLNGVGNAVVWHQIRNDKLFLTPYNPAHRIRWRCTTNNNFPPTGAVKPWQADFGISYYGNSDKWDTLLVSMTYPEAFSGSLILGPLMFRAYDTSGTHLPFGSDDNRMPGYVRDVRFVGSNVWGAISEDILKVMFQGAMQTFRLFYCSDSGMWIAMGPETD